MARVGVRRASPAGRRTSSGGEEAARRRTVAAGGASMPEALHDEAKGRVRAQIGRGEGGGAVGARNRRMAHRRRRIDGGRCRGRSSWRRQWRNIRKFGGGFGALCFRYPPRTQLAGDPPPQHCSAAGEAPLPGGESPCASGRTRVAACSATARIRAPAHAWMRARASPRGRISRSTSRAPLVPCQPAWAQPGFARALPLPCYKPETTRAAPLL